MKMKSIIIILSAIILLYSCSSDASTSKKEEGVTHDYFQNQEITDENSEYAGWVGKRITAGPNLVIKKNYTLVGSEFLDIKGKIEVINPDTREGANPVVVIFGTSSTTAGAAPDINIGENHEIYLGENTVAVFRSQGDINISSWNTTGPGEILLYTQASARDVEFTFPSNSVTINAEGTTLFNRDIEWNNNFFLKEDLQAEDIEILCISTNNFKGEDEYSKVLIDPLAGISSIDEKVSYNFSNLPSGTYYLEMSTMSFAFQTRSRGYIDKIPLGRSGLFHVKSDYLIDDDQDPMPYSSVVEFYDSSNNILTGDTFEVDLNESRVSFNVTNHGSSFGHGSYIYYTTDGSEPRYPSGSSLSSNSSLYFSDYNQSPVTFKYKVKVKGYQVQDYTVTKDIVIKLPPPSTNIPEGKVPYSASGNYIYLDNHTQVSDARIFYSLNSGGFQEYFSPISINPGESLNIKSKLEKAGYNSTVADVTYKMQLPQPEVYSDYDSGSNSYIIKVKNPGGSVSNVSLYINGQARNVNFDNSGDYVIQDVRFDSNVNIDAYFEKSGFYTSDTAAYHKDIAIPFANAFASDLSALHVDFLIDNDFGRWIPNDGTASRAFSINISGKNAGNNDVLNHKTGFQLTRAKDKDYNYGVRADNNIYKNTDTSFRVYVQRDNNINIYNDFLIAEYTHSGTEYLAINYKEEYVGSMSKGIDSDGDGKMDSGLCYNDETKKLALFYNGQFYHNFYITVQDESISRAGDNFTFTGQLYAGAAAREFDLQTSNNSDFFAVYDKKMLWRANLYIDEGDGDTDWNNKYRWTSGNEWNKEYYTSFVGSLQPNDMALRNMYDSHGGQTIDIFEYTPMRTISGTPSSPDTYNNYVSGKVAYNYPNNSSSDFILAYGLDSPFDFNYKLVMQMLSIKQNYEEAVESPYSSIPLWELQRWATTKSPENQWKNYISENINNQQAYIPALGLLYQTYWSHNGDETGSNHSATARGAGTDCIGFAQRSASYNNNIYAWADFAGGIANGDNYGGTVTYAPRQFPYVDSRSVAIAEHRQTNYNGGYLHLDKVVPGDILYYAKYDSGKSDGYHIAIVRDVIHSEDGSVLAGNIKLIESTFNSGSMAYIIKNKTLDDYSARKWFIVRLNK